MPHGMRPRSSVTTPAKHDAERDFIGATDMLYIAIGLWLACAVAVGTMIQNAPTITEVYDMMPRKYYRRITYKAKRWGYVAWLHSDPSIRQAASHPRWSSPEEAEAAADIWASEFFIASETPNDAKFLPRDERCDGR